MIKSDFLLLLKETQVSRLLDEKLPLPVVPSDDPTQHSIFNGILCSPPQQHRKAVFLTMLSNSDILVYEKVQDWFERDFKIKSSQYTQYCP